MMFNYPFSSYSNFRRPPPSGYPFYFKQPIYANSKKNPESIPSIENKPPIVDNNNKEDCLFNIFGIKLYFDDLLLICLIFFLYNEGVKDQSLFIILILLLLS